MGTPLRKPSSVAGALGAGNIEFTIVNSTETVEVLDISHRRDAYRDRDFGRSRRPRRRSRYPVLIRLARLIRSARKCCVGPLPGCLMRKHTSRGLNRGP
ncbi:MAG TPA: hypothetical protein VGM10_14160, partial [Actinocrinis sp.]